MNEKIIEYLNSIKSKNFKETLFSFIDNSGYKDSEIYKKAEIDRKLFSKIRSYDLPWDWSSIAFLLKKVATGVTVRKSEINEIVNPWVSPGRCG